MAKKNIGLFITFEGSEGCGKSTQSKLLADYLRQKGYPVILLREPGATKIGEKIRNILLDCDHQSMSPICEMLLYMAARAQLVEEIIKPALKKGKIVVCDRFLDSTIVYQGYGLGMDINMIKYIGKFVNSGLRPDLTIFLDLPLTQGLAYRRLQKDRIEQRPLSYHKRVRNGYFCLARKEPKRIKIVSVHHEKAATQEKVRGIVKTYVTI